MDADVRETLKVIQNIPDSEKAIYLTAFPTQMLLMEIEIRMQHAEERLSYIKEVLK